MAMLSKERDRLLMAVRSYKSLFDTTNQLIAELRSALLALLVVVALCNRADHYIFILFLLLLLLSFFFVSFFSSPNLSSRRLDVYHTSAHGVVLV